MRAGAQWLRSLWGGPQRGAAVLTAYQRRLPKDLPDTRAVLADLALFCGVHQSSHVPGDPCSTAYQEGRREVFLHIAEMLQMSVDDLTTTKDVKGLFNE